MDFSFLPKGDTKKNVLLVDEKSRVRNARPSLALCKISTLLKKDGHNVKYLVHRKTAKLDIGDFIPDKVMISLNFSWHAPLLAKFTKQMLAKYPNLMPKDVIIGGVSSTHMKDYILREFGDVKLVSGCIRRLDNILPDNTIYEKHDLSRKKEWKGNSYVFTMRGCPRKCPWCIVPTIERDQYAIPNWEEQINLEADNLVIADNNLLSANMDHKKTVFDYLRKIANENDPMMSVEFDGGVDFRFFNETNTKLMKGIRYRIIRVAWDDVRYEKMFDEKVTPFIKDFSHYLKREKIQAFVLYNNPHSELDTIEDAYYRIHKLYHHYGIMPYAMRYQPLESVRYKKYLSPNWNSRDAKDIGRWANNRFLFPRMVPFFKFYASKDSQTVFLGKLMEGKRETTLQRKLYKEIKQYLTLRKLNYEAGYEANKEIIKKELEERSIILNALSKHKDAIKQWHLEDKRKRKKRKQQKRQQMSLDIAVAD